MYTKFMVMQDNPLIFYILKRETENFYIIGLTCCRIYIFINMFIPNSLSHCFLRSFLNK